MFLGRREGGLITTRVIRMWDCWKTSNSSQWFIWPVPTHQQRWRLLIAETKALPGCTAREHLPVTPVWLWCSDDSHSRQSGKKNTEELHDDDDDDDDDDQLLWREVGLEMTQR